MGAPGTTPGPWSASEHPEGFQFEVLDARGDYLVGVDFDDRSYSEARKTAHQIAASDALYDALELALEYWSHKLRRYKNRCPVWVKEARAALALARGEQP